MSKTMYWGIAALMIILIAAGGFIYYQWSGVQQLKEELAQDAKMLEGNEKPVTENKPPRPAREGYKWEWHGNRWHEMPVAQSDSPHDTPINAPEMRAEKVEKTTADVPVSPHGFGPFPEVPDDYIIKPFSWDFYKNDPPIFELMARVRVKLWKQGILTTGITHANGLVYPTIPGTVFVKRYNRDGDNFIEMRGSPRDDLEAIRESLMDGNVPNGITVRDMDQAGIDPYTFLDLKK